MELTREKEGRYLDRLAEVTIIEPIAKVARAHLGKLPMAVATGALRDVPEQTLRLIAMSDWFDALVTSNDVTHLGRSARRTHRFSFRDFEHLDSVGRDSQVPAQTRTR